MTGSGVFWNHLTRKKAWIWPTLKQASFNIVMSCLPKISVLTCLWLWVCSAKGCEFLNYRPYHNHSMVVRTNSGPCSRDLYRCGLQCQRDSGCRAFTESEHDGVEAVCSETPGLLQSSAVYVIRRNVQIQGNCLPICLLFSYQTFLAHWGRVTHICVGNLTIIGSDNALSPDRRQAIIWTNAGILLIGPLGTNFSEILIAIQTFSLTKTRLKMSSAECCSFCLGLNVLTNPKVNYGI